MFLLLPLPLLLVELVIIVRDGQQRFCRVNRNLSVL